MKINIISKFKNLSGRIIVIYIAVISLAITAIIVQLNITQVAAQVIPITVNTDHLQFGTVFPGEELFGSFVVGFAGEEIVNYRILQRRKSLPLEHPEFPDGGDPDMPGFFRDLCPYLSKISLEGEGDTEGEKGSASVSEIDTSDTWRVEFRVPAIVGQIAQDHTDGFVSENGEYGCDIVVDVEETDG